MKYFKVFLLGLIFLAGNSCIAGMSKTIQFLDKHQVKHMDYIDGEDIKEFRSVKAYRLAGLHLKFKPLGTHLKGISHCLGRAIWEFKAVYGRLYSFSSSEVSLIFTQSHEQPKKVTYPRPSIASPELISVVAKEFSINRNNYPLDEDIESLLAELKKVDSAMSYEEIEETDETDGIVRIKLSSLFHFHFFPNSPGVEISQLFNTCI